MSKKFNLNLNWYFKPSFDVTDINNTSVEGFEKINLPHTVKELSYNCFSHEETAMVSTYMRKLTIPQEYAGRRAILVFDGVMARYELYVNGQKVTEHRGGYSRSFADITKFLGAGENTIVIEYSSNLINAVLTEGILVESEDYNGWWNNDVKYLSYGPAQAVIVPYCEEAI